MSKENHRISFASIGLAYLENAILDTLGKRNMEPGHLARQLGIYPDVRDYGRSDDQLSGNLLVRAILVSLQKDGRVQSSEYHPRSWKLTEKELHLRGYS